MRRINIETDEKEINLLHENQKKFPEKGKTRFDEVY
jgi:hypothetical protein